MVRDLTLLDSQIPATQPLPFRLVVLGFDGNPGGLKTLCTRLRAGAQLVAVVPATTLANTIQLLSDPRCNHVVVADDEGLATLSVTINKFVTGDLFGIE